MFIGMFLVYIIWLGFIAIVLYGLYYVLDTLLNKYLVVKREQNDLFKEFIEVMKEKKKD